VRRIFKIIKTENLNGKEGVCPQKDSVNFKKRKEGNL
jgi:hypothetical protein